MKRYKFKVNGNSYDVKIDSVEENHAVVDVNGVTYEVELEKNQPLQKHLS